MNIFFVHMYSFKFFFSYADASPADRTYLPVHAVLIYLITFASLQLFIFQVLISFPWLRILRNKYICIWLVFQNIESIIKQYKRFWFFLVFVLWWKRGWFCSKILEWKFFSIKIEARPNNSTSLHLLLSP